MARGKVLQLCSYYLGSEVYRKLFDALDSLGVSSSIYVFTSVESGAKLPQQNNVTISPCFRNRDRYIFHWKHRKVWKDLHSKLDVSSYDVVHAHSLFSNGYLAYGIKKTLGTPYIVAVRNTDVNVFFKKMPHLRGLGRKILRNAEKIVFLSEAYRDTVLQEYIAPKDRESLMEKIEVIPNGIDDYWHEHRGAPKRMEKDKPLRLVYVGAVSPKKNLDVLVQATKLLTVEGLDVALNVAGKIKEERYLKLLEETPNVSYVGFLPREALLELYRSSDVFVLPSKFETFGLVYGEAMSQGLPVVYSAGQGFDRQFEEGVVGYRVDSASPREIAVSIRKILKDYEGFSKRAVSLSERFRWSTIAKVYGKMYAESKK